MPPGAETAKGSGLVPSRGDIPEWPSRPTGPQRQPRSLPEPTLQHRQKPIRRRQAARRCQHARISFLAMLRSFRHKIDIIDPGIPRNVDIWIITVVATYADLHKIHALAGCPPLLHKRPRTGSVNFLGGNYGNVAISERVQMKSRALICRNIFRFNPARK